MSAPSYIKENSRNDWLRDDDLVLHFETFNRRRCELCIVPRESFWSHRPFYCISWRRHILSMEMRMRGFLNLSSAWDWRMERKVARGGGIIISDS